MKVIKLSNLDGAHGFRVDGVTEGDHLGFSVSGAGDVNGDGFDDLIIGAPDANLGAGSSYVVLSGNFTASVTRLGMFKADNLHGTKAADRFVTGNGNDEISCVYQ